MIRPPAIELVTPIPHEDWTLIAQKRAAIDLIAITRATVIRFGLFGAYLYRPNPRHPDSDDVRESWIAEMRTHRAGFARSFGLLSGRDSDGVFRQVVCDWIATVAARHPADCAKMREMLLRSTRLIDAVDGDGAVFERLLIDHAVYARTDFSPALTRLCEGFWADLDDRRNSEILRAQETGSAIGTTLSRLERIGRHVRLTSLNASVEAARVGEAGKGLGVIAQEFKALAEEIQSLAVTAREDITAITRRDG